MEGQGVCVPSILNHGNNNEFSENEDHHLSRGSVHPGPAAKSSLTPFLELLTESSIVGGIYCNGLLKCAPTWGERGTDSGVGTSCLKFRWVSHRCFPFSSRLLLSICICFLSKEHWFRLPSTIKEKELKTVSEKSGPSRHLVLARWTLVCTTPGSVLWFLRELIRFPSSSKVSKVDKRSCRSQVCASEKPLHDFQNGLELYSANSLLRRYIMGGKLHKAQELFDKLKTKDTVSWTIMIGGYAKHGQALDAIELYKKMRDEGGRPDAVTYLSALQACAIPTALTWGKIIHAHIMRDGFQSDVRVSNALVHMYARCGSVDDAKNVFEKMVVRDVIRWNTIVGCLARDGRWREAFSCFHQMQKEGVSPNAATYMSILNSNVCEGALARVKEVHSHAVRSGLNADLRVGSALVHMYGKIGSVQDARVVFNKMEERDLISWNVIIGALAQNGCGHEAFSLFLQMQREGFTPDKFTYVSILNSCSSAGALEWVKEVHSHAKKAGLHVDLRVGNALVHMYAKSGNIADARQAFDQMPDRDVVSGAMMIGGLAQHGHGREALQLFDQMRVKDIKPNGILFVAVLSACKHAGLVEEGRYYFVSMMRDYGIEPALEHHSCIVDMLGRAGHLEEAKLFILNMPIKPNVVTWGALLGACRTYNDYKLAELSAKECLKLEPKDPSSYVLLSNIYAAIGNWDQVSVIRSMMEERSIRKDPGLCWIEVHNKVHHFVVGDTSHLEARKIYAKLNNLFDRLKAEGYIPDTRLVLRNMDLEDKESALHYHSEKIAIAYGLMHVTPGKPIRIYKNLRICSDCHVATKLISKVTGREIVARDANRFHHFKDGLCSCGDYW